MSGLSLATVLVEAGVSSGARIQAERALEHGRPVSGSRVGFGQRVAREALDGIDVQRADFVHVGALTGRGAEAELEGRRRVRSQRGDLRSRRRAATVTVTREDDGRLSTLG
jgi:hypothetical protein